MKLFNGYFGGCIRGVLKNLRGVLKVNGNFGGLGVLEDVQEF